MNEELKKKLTDAGLGDVVTLLEASATKTAELEKAIAEKDAIIAQKTEDVVGVRQKMQQLKELTEEEKKTMSQKEIELHETIRGLQGQISERDKADSERQEKEIGARRAAAFKKFAGTDPELNKKLEESFKSIVDHDKAQTEEEIAAVAQKAFNMLGVPAPDPVTAAMNGMDGGAGGDPAATGFADSEKGKGLTEVLGLPTEPPAATT